MSRIPMVIEVILKLILCQRYNTVQPGNDWMKMRRTQINTNNRPPNLLVLVHEINVIIIIVHLSTAIYLVHLSGHKYA